MRGADRAPVVTADDAARALAALPLWDVVDGDARRALTASAYRRHLARRQVLFVTGEPTDVVHVVAAGRVKVVVSAPSGDELVLAVAAAGDVLGGPGLVDGGPRSAGAVALEDAVVWCVPTGALRGVLERQPRAALAVAQELAGQLRVLTGATADLVLVDLPRRLTRLLLRDDTAADGLSQTELAARLGVARQSLNRTLSELQGRGWVEAGRGGVRVRDRQALEEFAAS